ncbi:peptidase [Propionibacteriaceae bacterium Y2011]|uniref:peptidase n=1 Tax=Microlunatus sp. Y2014 TaxID=3418488 RepID=UPI003B4A356B
MDDRQVELAPFTSGRRPLDGFIVAGRWPDGTGEWAQLLRLLVRLAAVPGMIGRTSVFWSCDDQPEISDPSVISAHDPVGMLLMAGPVIGDDAPAPGTVGSPQPMAMMLLHPTAESPRHNASGCVLLPGLPHLGLEHRAAWVETEADGTITKLVSEDDVDPSQDPDTAVLALLLAA